MKTNTALIEALRCAWSECICQKNGSSKHLLHCPAHEDHSPSLSLTERDGKILVRCHAGCDQDAVLNALHAKGLWGKPSPSVKPVTPLQPSKGLTLFQLAEAKKLPIEFMKALRVSDYKYSGTNAVRIPYSDVSGSVEAVRFRLSLGKEGIRFSWRKGDHPILYGLDRLQEIHRSGWVLLVEGESDSWTLWHHGLPALGIPGKSTWRSDWADHLKGLDVFIWQEQDAADLTDRIARSIPTAKVIPAPEGIKDPSEAHLLGYDLSVWLESLKQEATPVETLKRDTMNVRIAELEAKADGIINVRNPLEFIESEIDRLGYGGDIKPALIVYLAATSRVLAMRHGSMPVHLLVLGAPSGCKSYTVSTVRRLFSQEAFHVIDAGSPRALIYDNADLRHRVVVFGEADSLPSGEDNPAASAIRNLLQDNRLHYKVVVPDPDTGGYIVKDIEKPGPTVLITTSVKPLGEQLMTRLFTLEISDEPSQLQAALRKQAEIEVEGSYEPLPAFLAFQDYLQAKAPWEVHVPYAPAIAELVGKSVAAARITRDFARLLSFIKAVAVIHHSHRRVDDQGRIVAEIEDYTTVRGLVNQMYADSATGANKGIKDVVEAVKRLRANAKSFDTVSVTKVAKELDIGKMAASRRVKSALASGWLINQEARKRHPYDLVIGEPFPEFVGSPLPEDMTRCNAVTTITDGVPSLPSLE